MKFTEYCASFITPQMTLLEKLNKILKFLLRWNPDSEQNSGTRIYCHTIKVKDADEDMHYEMTIFSFDKNPYTSLSYKIAGKNFISGAFETNPIMTIFDYTTNVYSINWISNMGVSSTNVILISDEVTEL